MWNNLTILGCYVGIASLVIQQPLNRQFVFDVTDKLKYPSVVAVIRNEFNTSHNSALYCGLKPDGIDIVVPPVVMCPELSLLYVPPTQEANTTLPNRTRLKLFAKFVLFVAIWSLSAFIASASLSIQLLFTRWSGWSVNSGMEIVTFVGFSNLLVAIVLFLLTQK